MMTPMTPCREYQGPLSTSGYGRLRVGPPGERRQVQLHRWVVEQIEGALTRGEVVMHLCDNRPCFRYEHLKRGTQAENIRDAHRKGTIRVPDAKGQRNPRARLTEEDVVSIRERFVKGHRSRPGTANAEALALEFNITAEHVRSIARGDAWSH